MFMANFHRLGFRAVFQLRLFLHFRNRVRRVDFFAFGIFMTAFAQNFQQALPPCATRDDSRVAQSVRGS